MNILFLCVGNSARSQIAEGLAKEMLPTKFTIKSAGSSPSGFIHEGAFSIMKEIGIDISKQTSKGINDLDKEFIKLESIFGVMANIRLIIFLEQN